MIKITNQPQNNNPIVKLLLALGGIVTFGLTLFLGAVALFFILGFVVLVSLISPYRSERKKARDIRPEIFKQIYVKASLDECKKRDVKGLYSKAVSGEIENFTGISSPYEDPKNPDLILNTDKESIEESVKKLEDFIIKDFGISKNS